MADNQPRIVGYDPNTGMPVYSSASSGGKNIIKGVLIGLIVLILAVAGWFIYDNFFNYEALDLFANDQGITTEGYNGSGILTDYITEYDGDFSGAGQMAPAFYNSIYYTADVTEGLSNGDKVTVTASYDKDLAKQIKVKAKETSREYTVEGLRERYASNGSDIEQSNFAAIKQYMNDYMVREYNSSSDNRKSEGMVKLYFVSPVTTDSSGDYEDFMYAIYKVTYDGWDDKRETEYISLVMKPIDKGYDYTTQIDQLVKDGIIEVYEDGYNTNAANMEQDFLNRYNRDTKTSLKI